MLRYTGYVDPHALLVVAAIFIGGALKGIWSGWFAKETEPAARKIATQRQRYGFVFAGQTIIVAVFAGMYYFIGGPAEHQAAFQWFADANLGWYANVVAFAVVTLLAAGAVSPVFTLIAVIAIYRYPAEMAYKRRGGYVPTVAHRRGSRQTENFAVLIDPESRQVQRAWF